MSVFTFRKAERKKIKLKIGLTGPAGSGKTYTALRLARGMAGDGGKIAMINTEKNRGEIYATEFEYDILNLEPPYSPERFIEAIDSACESGYSVLILDSASHEWIGLGGVLDMNKKMQGNSFANWAKLTPRHDAFIDKITSSDVHMIVAMRGKDEYVMEEDDKGKQVPKKVGLGPQQRDGFEYEFHVAFNLDMQHVASSVKDNSHFFDGTYKVLTEEDGERLLAWAESGIDSPEYALKNEIRKLLRSGRGQFTTEQEEYLTRVLESSSESKLEEAVVRAKEYLEKLQEQKERKQESA